MGQKQDAVIDQNDEDLETLDESPDATKEGDATGDESQDDEEGEGQASESEGEDENEIVLEGDTQPQKGQVPIGVSKRFRQLTGKNKELESENSESVQRAVNAEAERDVYKLALQQEQEKSASVELKYPNADDFDGGSIDPQYTTAVQEYIEKSVADGIGKAAAKLTETSTVQQTQQVKTADSEVKIKEHFERATKLKVKDYEETEGKAIDLLGNELAAEVIESVGPGSELIFYHWGKHPEKVAAFKELIKTRDGSKRALVELGGLVTKLKVKPKSANSAPGPDNALPGGNPSKSRLRGPPGATYS